MSCSPELVFDATAFAETAVARAEDALVVIPAPPLDAESFLATGSDPLLWHAPGAEAIAGLGRAIRVEARGAARFESVRDALRLAAIETIVASGAPAVTPRLFGAFEFERDGRASFVLPRWLRGESWLALQVTRGDGDAMRRALLAELPRKLSGARFDGAVRAGGLRLEDGFPERVRRALGSIERGELVKVVLSEAARAECDASPIALVSRLRGAPGWRFLLSLGTSSRVTSGVTSFLGVSPERLVRRTGRAVEVDALAGSRRNEESDALARSVKDLAEQRIVLDEIAAALRPFCSRLDVPAEPSPKRFAHVTHLHSHISGVLGREAHVLDLAHALHPTPAVGGAPRDAALAAITELEGEPRGWWAGPVGWFDANGDGELVVAIRSMVLEGGVAHLRAGAGIVRGSEPELERAEIALKRRSLLDALEVPR